MPPSPPSDATPPAMPDGSATTQPHAVAALWLENLRRLRLIGTLIVPLNLLHVAVFMWTPATPGTHLWRLGVLWTHAVMAVLMTALGLAAHRWLQRRSSDGQAPTGTPTLVGMGMVAGLFFPALLALIDQQVTPSITPMLLGCLGLSMVFHVPPRLAAGLYAAALGLMVVALPFVQPDASMRLSNQVNALTAAALGLTLCIILWRKTLLTHTLQHELHAQNLRLQAQQIELQRLATQDPLTGLLNPREFRRQANQVLALAARSGQPTSLVMLDLDYFKRINDDWGHPAGDEVLRQTAEHLRQPLRHSDVLARHGGEEFMLLLPNTGAEEATRVAQKLRQHLENQPIHLPQATLRITSSFGVATGAPGDDLDTLYHQADAAVYQAKAEGRNRVVSAPYFVRKSA